MISENLAREFWGAPSPRWETVPRVRMPWWEVIGVSQDVRENGIQERAPDIVYWPTMLDTFGPGPWMRTHHQFAIRSDRAGTESFLTR